MIYVHSGGYRGTVIVRSHFREDEVSFEVRSMGYFRTARTYVCTYIRTEVASEHLRMY